MRKLRLVLTYECPKDCEMCCNKDPQFRRERVPNWDLSVDGFDEIIITGGEPMLDPLLTYAFMMTMKFNGVPGLKTYIYTAYAQVDHEAFFRVLRHVSGITFTIHDQEDVEDFLRLNFFLAPLKRYILDNNKSMQLHVFKGVDLLLTNPTFWRIKDNIEWIPNCPLPKGEILRKYIII